MPLSYTCASFTHSHIYTPLLYSMKMKMKLKMKMSVSQRLFSLLLALSLFIHCASAHDITQILNQYPEFSSFNSYLTQTNLAADINARQSITVLVVDNANLSPLSSTPSPDTIKNILSVHVILDYYDVAKLQGAGSSALLATLFQSTGLAKGQQGFLTLSHPTAASTAFGSAMPGSSLGSTVLKSVASQPYNISVIQISSPIIPQGIDGTKTSSPPSTTPSAASSPPSTTPSTTPSAASPPLSTAPTTTPSAASPPLSTAPSTTPSAIPPPPPLPPTPATAAPPTPIIKAPVPSVATSTPTTAPASSPPTEASAPIKVDAPTSAVSATPSATPGSAPTPGALVDTPPATSGTTPAADKPQGKSAATTLEMGLAVACTVALSSVYMSISTLI